MKAITDRFRRWNEWRKRNLNHPVYKFLVLIGLAISPTFEFYYHNYLDDLKGK